MKKNKNGIIFQVSSKYCLKTIFSHLEYNRFLKIIKYNKKLQKLLEISPKNYSLECEVKTEKTETRTTEKLNFQKIALVNAIIKVILFLFQYVYIFIFLVKSPYRKLDIGSKYYNLITGFFSFLNYFFYFYIMLSIVLFLILEKESTNFIVLPIIDFILFLFVNCMLTWILTVILKLENYHRNWIVNCFIILFSLYCFITVFDFIFIILLSYCKEINIVNYIYTYFLNKINGIQINDIEISESFLKKNKKEQKKYILSIFDKLEYKYSDSQTKIINLINFNRDIKRIPKLLPVKSVNRLIIEGNTEISLLFNHVFKLKKDKYLFKYQKGEFYKNLQKNNDEIIKILSIIQLNKVEMFEKDNYEYIIVYNDNEYLSIGANLRTPHIEKTERKVFIHNMSIASE